MYLMPRSKKYFTLAKSDSIGAPFSIPKGSEIRAFSKFSITSLGVPAEANKFGKASGNLPTMSIRESAKALAPPDF